MSILKFNNEVQSNIKALSKDTVLAENTKTWFEQSLVNKYSLLYLPKDFLLQLDILQIQVYLKVNLTWMIMDI